MSDANYLSSASQERSPGYNEAAARHATVLESRYNLLNNMRIKNAYTELERRKAQAAERLQTDAARTAAVPIGNLVDAGSAETEVKGSQLAEGAGSGVTLDMESIRRTINQIQGEDKVPSNQASLANYGDLRREDVELAA